MRCQAEGEHEIEEVVENLSMKERKMTEMKRWKREIDRIGSLGDVLLEFLPPLRAEVPFSNQPGLRKSPLN